MIFQNYLKFHSPKGRREITYNNFEISLVVFMPNTTTNHAITYTNSSKFSPESFRIDRTFLAFLNLIFKSSNILVILIVKTKLMKLGQHDGFM